MTTVGFDAWFTLLVVASMFAFLVRGYSTAMSIMGAVVVLLVAGVIDQRQAFSGFSNAAPMTVAALYVVARAVERTGALEPFARFALDHGSGESRTLLRMLVPSAAASAFLNNTPIVAMLMPTICSSADRQSIAPSRLLMPLSFAVILGGVVTTIGTSTNLVVSGLLQESGHAPFSLFEVSHVGLPIALIGIAFVALAAPLILPDRQSPRRQLSVAERDFVVRMVVDEGGGLNRRTVEDAGLRHLEGVFLVEIERDGDPITPVAPTTVLKSGDHLLFAGQARLVADLRNLPGLRSAEKTHLADLDTAGRLIEVVIGAGSPLLGRTPKDVGFRMHYGAAIVGIHREGHPVAAKLGEVKLRLGDTLLLLADAGFRDHWRDRPDFLVISPLADDEPTRMGRSAYLSLAITFLIVVAAGSGAMSILHAAAVGALLLIATRALSLQQARGSIDMEVLVVIAGAFGVGAAIEQSGLGALIGHQVVTATHGLDPRWTLVGIALATVVLTEFISNNASAALMFPIAMATAAEVGADPRDFAIAVAVAASCSFITPIGYQTNTMVYGPGGYRFSDYWQLGAPLTVVALVMIFVMA